jgi:hypothetical protein
MTEEQWALERADVCEMCQVLSERADVIDVAPESKKDE